jgi:hypothetical protein
MKLDQDLNGNDCYKLYSRKFTTTHHCQWLMNTPLTFSLSPFVRLFHVNSVLVNNVTEILSLPYFLILTHYVRSGIQMNNINSLLSSQLTPWSRVLEKLTVTQSVMEFPTFYGTHRYITMFTTACHQSLS